ncbi:LPXTG cell wall anchor domain-containing protein [Pseudoflavonifractor capillosus]|uniref:LPXTG cell wall anchor domain-containing protein n=1 Tax=Pseudoflavonifractor capillosus TaxID=106588 RepID=UPI00195C5AA9|nr:LPXTG cell wall anchor domain-containing protein [Pseudoflavonifractor capillosus]MBM6895925.1 LPXTG cell wall anchor domain-containing protein [Pseudoflavonifractor capillosus]
MKLKRKLLAGLLTLCMAVGMAVPAFAENGPSSGDMSAAWVQLYDSSVEEPDGSYFGYVLYSNGGEADTVEGAVYDKATNTITLTNYNHPEMTLATNEMGDDLKLHLVGDNHIAELVVWGFGWGGNLEITGDGSLTINENKTSQTAAIRFMAEGTQGLLKVGSNASVTAYKSAGENTYSAAFVSTTSSTLPFTGNLETELALTANSGIEGETTEWENVIYESNYVAQDWKVLTKGEDGKKYGVSYGTIYTGSDLTNGKPVGYIHELVKVEGLPSQKEYLAVQIATVDGLEKDALPEGYTDSGETISAKIGDISSMTVLIKDGQRFYWGVDPNHSQWLVYQTAVDDVTAEDWGQTTLTKIVVPVAGEGVSGATEEDIPAGYTTNVVKTGMYSYYCTNDVIKVSPSGTSTDPGTDPGTKPGEDPGTDPGTKPGEDPGTDPGTKPGEDTGAKDLTASETGVSISLTDGVPEGAELYADTIAQESVLGSRPELKEELPGLLSIYEISVRKDGKALEIKDNPMTVKIPMNDHLKGYKYYQAVYLGEELERFDAVAEGDFLVFETTHLSQYAILGSNTPFETSTVQDGEQTGAGDQSSDTTIPQTGDGSNMMLWIGLLAASGAGVYGMTLYSRKKKEQNI